MVPLRNEINAIGLVARVDRHGDSFLGYFFPSPSGKPQLDDVAEFRPQDAILIGATGVYGLRHGIWQVIGSAISWDRNDWPIPIFSRIDFAGAQHIETYGDDDVLLPMPAKDCELDQRIPKPAIHAGLMDAGFAENALWDFLKPWGEYAQRHAGKS